MSNGKCPACEEKLPINGNKRCANCGEWVHLECLIYSEEYDDNFCPECKVYQKLARDDKTMNKIENEFITLTEVEHSVSNFERTDGKDFIEYTNPISVRHKNILATKEINSDTKWRSCIIQVETHIIRVKETKQEIYDLINKCLENEWVRKQ